MIYIDDFAGAAGAPPDARYWDVDTCYVPHAWGDDGIAKYLPSAVAQDGSSNLVITASKTGGVWTSGRVMTKGKLTVGPGTHLEFRAKCDAGQGFWPGLWLLGDNDNRAPVGPASVAWPACGEIDVLESANAMTTVHGSLHFPGHFGANPVTNTTVPPVNLTSFHTFSVDWWPSEFVFKVDGIAYGTVLRDAYGSWPFGDGSQFYVIMELAVGGSFPGAPDGTTPAVGKLTVDYFSVSSFNAGYRTLNGPDGLVAFNPLVRTQGQARPGLWS